MKICLHHDHSSTVELHRICDCSRNPSWFDSVWELLNPGNSSALVSSGDYRLCVCWKNDGLSTFVFLSVREDSWNSIREEVVQAGCRLLRVIALIICWTQRRIYSCFKLPVKTLLYICVCFGKRWLERATNRQRKKLLSPLDHILFQRIEPVCH